ncbi:MAG: hypothetical protein ACTSRW_03235 [Candidatus Helarchaeota archaeon]
MTNFRKDDFRIKSLFLGSLILFSLFLSFMPMIPFFLATTYNPSTIGADPFPLLLKESNNIAPPLTIYEHANRTNSDQEIMLYYNETSGEIQNMSAYVSLPSTWDGNRIEMYLNDIYENRCWIKDVDFESTGNWTAHASDFSSISHPGWNYAIEDGEGVNNSRGIHIKLNNWDQGNSRSVYYTTTDASFEQNISIERGSVNWAGLQFDYKVNSSWSLEGAGAFKISVAVDQTDLQSPSNKIYFYYNYTDRGVPDLSYLQKYDIVVWATGWTTTNTLTSSDRMLITNYLNDKGKLLLTGQGISYEFQNPPESTWLYRYLHANHSGQLSSGQNLDGIAGGIFDGINDYALYSLASPCYFDDPSPDADVPLKYDVVQSSRQRSTINWSSSTHENATMFFGFDISDVLADQERTDLINRTLNWLNSSYQSVLFIDDTRDVYGDFITSSFEDIGLEDAWKKVHLISFHEIEQKDTWYNTGIVPISTANLPNNGTHVNLNLKIGLTHSADISYGSEPNPEIWIDNFQLYLKSKVKPSNVSLTMNDILVDDIGENSGSVTQLGSIEYDSINQRVEGNFSFTPTISSTDPVLPIDLTFKVDMNLFANTTGSSLHAMDPSKIGMNYEVQDNSTCWEFYYYVGVPSHFGNHTFNFSTPRDWNLTYVAEPIYPLINRISDIQGGHFDGYASIPTTNMTEYPDGYWIIRADSNNYVQEIQTQVFTGSTWSNSTEFFVTNKSRVIARIGTKTQTKTDLAGSMANLTIQAPNGTTWWSGQSIGSSNGWVIFPNITIGSTNTTGGSYQVMVQWTNGTESGQNSTVMNIVHQSSISLREPFDARIDDTTEMKYGDLLLIRVRANDTNTNQLISGLNVQLNWSTGILNLTDQGTGEYDIVLDTTELTFQNDKNYTLEINSTSQYYSNCSLNLIIIFRFETILTHDPINSVPYGGNATILLNYETLVGDPIPDATIDVNASIIGAVTFNESNNNKYKLIVNTTGLSSTDLLNITASRFRFDTQQILVPVPLRDTFTELKACSQNTTIIEIPYGENDADLYIVFNDTEFDQLLSNATISFLGYSQVNYVDISNGMYRINFTASSQTKSYNVLITASKEHYLDSSLQVILRTLPWTDFIDTSISDGNVQVGIVGETVEFTFDFFDRYHGTSLGVDNLATYEWIHGSGSLQYVNGHFILPINTFGMLPGQYEVNVYVRNQNGDLLAQETVTLVVNTPPLSPLFLVIFLLVGIGVTLLGLLFAYRIRKKVRERHWERKIKHIYLFYKKTGAAIFDRRVGGEREVDSSLVTSALLGISSIVSEITKSDKPLKSISHFDSKIIFSHGNHVTAAIMADEDLHVIRNQLNGYVNEFELCYTEDLKDWNGDIERFKLAGKILSQYFPLAETIPKALQITARWSLDNLQEIHGLHGARVLEAIGRGYFTIKEISKEVKISEKETSSILKTLYTFGLIDKKNHLQSKGKEALKLYQQIKEKINETKTKMKEKN